MALNAHYRRVLVAAVLVVGLLGALGAFAVGFFGALLSDSVSTAALRAALVWTEIIAAAALLLLAGTLFAAAWYLRERIITPLDKLRRSLTGTATGDIHAVVWGIERKDEVGAIARTAERWRQAVAARMDERFSEVTLRLRNGAERLETELERMAVAAQEAQRRVEASSARAATASHAATEAASLAKEGASRMVQKAEATIQTTGLQARLAMDALTRAVTRLTDATSRLNPSARAERSLDALLAPPETRPALLVTQTGAPEPDSGDALVQDLIGDLDALERFARERKTIAGEQAVALTAALVEAIDRLNAVADRVSAAADDDDPIRAAG